MSDLTPQLHLRIAEIMPDTALLFAAPMPIFLLAPVETVRMVLYQIPKKHHQQNQKFLKSPSMARILSLRLLRLFLGRRPPLLLPRVLVLLLRYDLATFHIVKLILIGCRNEQPGADTLVGSFRDFVTNEKQRLTQKKQAIVKSEMDKRMADLIKFSRDFKVGRAKSFRVHEY